MKTKICLILVLSAVVFIAGGCAEYDMPTDNSLSTGQMSQSEITTGTSIENITTIQEQSDITKSTEKITTFSTVVQYSSNVQNETSDFSALELLGGYRIEEDGYVYIDYKHENNCDFDLFRDYFFGTWEGWSGMLGETELILDDSEKSDLNDPASTWLFYTLHLYNNTLIITRVDSVDTNIFWLDIEEPNVLYTQVGSVFPDKGFRVFNTNNSDDIGYQTKSLIKTDALINEPENGFLSELMLLELKSEYNLEVGFFSETDYVLDDCFFTLYGQPTYLISKTSDKIALKTKLVFGYGSAFLDVIYITERIGGNWEHRREISRESIETARDQLIELGYLSE